MKQTKVSSAIKISLVYFVTGSLWILFTDRTLLLLFPASEILSKAQTYKGWLFILVTSFALYILIRRTLTAQQKAEQAIFEIEERHRRLVEKLPAVVFMDEFGSAQTSRYISPRIKDLLGYATEEWINDNLKWETLLHEDDRERVLAEDKRTNLTREPFRVEYRLRHRDGHYVWIKEDASVVMDENGNPAFWQGILLDITEQKQAQEALMKRDAILRAVGYAAEQFLKSANWEDAIQPVLETLGRTTAVSRVYLFKKAKKGNEKILVSQVYEWCDENAESQIDNPDLQNIDLNEAGFKRWVNAFDQELPLFGIVREFPEEEQALLNQQSILSLVCLPIPIGADWWGFIGFDECRSERTWTETEIEALRAAASTLGSAIHRTQAEEALKDSERSYRGLFNAVRDAIYIQDENGFFLDVNEGATQMYRRPREYFIGKTPDHLGAPGRNDLQKILQAVKQAFNGIPQEFEFWGIRSDGEVFPKEVRLFKGTYFGKDVVVAIAQDITARKEAEAALQKQLRELSVLHAAALTEAAARDIDLLIQHITDLIGDTLYSDNCGILLLNETGDLLIPHFSYRGADIKHIGNAIPVTTGISGRVATTRRSARIGNVAFDPSYFEISAETRSELCVPIISGANVLGVLNVESKRLNAFTERDERLLNTIAGGLANAIERIQLFELEKKRRQQAEILREATQELTSSFDLEKLYEIIFRLLAKLVGYDSASIEILKNGQFTIVAGKNIPHTLIGSAYYANSLLWGGEEIPRQPVILSDVQTDERFIRFEETNYIRGWMGVPLIAHDKLIGFLNLDSRMPNCFTIEHASIAQTFANQAAIAIENARLFELEQKRRKEAEILRQATASLPNTLDMDSLLESILDWLEKLAPYDSASIILKHGNSLRLAAHRNLPANYQVGDEFPMTKKWNDMLDKRKPLIIEDVRSAPLFEAWEGSEYIRGWMSVPMLAQDMIIGFINIDSRMVGAYTEELEAPLQTFSNQAATAIEKTRLFELEKRRRETADIVRQAATALTNLLDLPSLHEAILDWLYKITPYDSASILEIEGNRVRITAARGLPAPEKALQQTFPLDNALCQIINATGNALIIDDCTTDPRFEKWGNAEYVRGWMGVPLASRGQIIGYITVDSRTPHAYSQNDAIAAQTFAQQAAISLENVKLYTETRQRLEELEIISRVSQALRAARDRKEIIPILLDEIKKSIGTETVSIALYDPATNTLTPNALEGILADLPKKSFRPGEGIIGRVFSSGIAHHSPEFIKDPLASPENANVFGEGWGGVAVPIRTANETIGVIMAATKKPNVIETHHSRLITTIAEIAGNAIHRSTLFEKSEEQVRRLTTLREMDTAITSSLDLRITLNIITEYLTTKTEANAATILVFNPDSQMLDYYAASGFKGMDLTRSSVNIGESLAGKILLTRQAIYINETNSQIDIPLNDIHAGEKFTSYYAIPLFSKGVTKGVLETYFNAAFIPSPDWLDFLQTLAGQATIAIDNAQLFESLQQTNQEISLAYDTTLEGWGKALELRDKETRGHTQRVTALTLELARQMGVRDADLIHLRRGALLHDIGKMGIPDSILRKAGTLTADEMEEMKKHPQYAFDLLAPIPYLRPALDIPYCHHEWWDGNGYPRGLKGEEIPLAARIFAIVDVWDALLSDRSYRDAWKEKHVLKYIKTLSGKQFDPAVVKAFLHMHKTRHTFIHSNYPPASKPSSKKDKKSTVRSETVKKSAADKK